MDVDNDIDSQLLQQFSSMATQDKDVLIAEFQKMLGNEMNPAGCAFFLDMNNWNLQEAICSYYDFEQPNVRLPQMGFLKDETVGEGEAVSPNTNFVKTWRIQNTGEQAWPPGCCLRLSSGEALGVQDHIAVTPLRSREIEAISVNMTSPAKAGIYQSQWRIYTGNGQCFGDIIWVILGVEENGLLGVTQQMNTCTGLGSPRSLQQIPTPNDSNPFGSPPAVSHAMPVGPVHSVFASPSNSHNAPVAFSSPTKCCDTPTVFGSPGFASSPFCIQGGSSPASLSMIAHPGSTPCSPSHYDTDQSNLSSSFPSTPMSHVRSSLFPTPDHSEDSQENPSPLNDNSMDDS